MAVIPINTKHGPRWLVRRQVGGVQLKKRCTNEAAARRLDAAWSIGGEPTPPRPAKPAEDAPVELSLVDRFLRARWV